MDAFGFKPESVAARVRTAGSVAPIPSHGRSLLIGAVGFTVASLVVFATVAFAERWMYQNLGMGGAYFVWTAMFILLAGGLLSALIIGPGRLGRFFVLFTIAFFLYAAGWIGAYFTIGGLAGEWLGSLAGTVLMAAAITAAFGDWSRLLGVALVLFAGNSFGYFLGSFLNSSLHSRTGMILWGVCFGLGLGTALGRAFYEVQEPIRSILSDPFKTRA